MYSSALLSSEKNGIAALYLKVILFVNASCQLSEKNMPYIYVITFVDDCFDEKWEEKFIFLCIIHCNKKKVF